VSTKNISWGLGGKGGRCLGLTTLPPSCADCHEIWGPQYPGTPVQVWLFLFIREWSFTWYSSVAQMDKEEVPLAFVTKAISHTELTLHPISSSTLSTFRFSVWCSYFVFRRSRVQVLVRKRAVRDMIFPAFPWFPLDKCQNSTVNITKASPTFIIDRWRSVRSFLLTASSYKPWINISTLSGNGAAGRGGYRTNCTEKLNGFRQLLPGKFFEIHQDRLFSDLHLLSTGAHLPISVDAVRFLHMTKRRKIIRQSVGKVIVKKKTPWP
jgi:hypothetical protein